MDLLRELRHGTQHESICLLAVGHRAESTGASTAASTGASTAASTAASAASTATALVASIAGRRGSAHRRRHPKRI